MLDFLLPIKIFSNNKNYPSFFVKDVIFHNLEYALVKLDLEEKDKEYMDEHGDVVTIAMPDKSGYNSVYKVLSPYFDNYQASNALKDKLELKEMFTKIVKNEHMTTNEKQPILKDIFNELGYPNIRVVSERFSDNNGKKGSINFIRDFEDVGYVYSNEDFDTYIKVTDEVISINHNQIFQICEWLKDSSIYRKAYNNVSTSNVYIEKPNDKLEIKITDCWDSNALTIKEGMSLNKKDIQLDSRFVNNIENYNEFKKLLSALHDSLYVKNKEF